MFVLQRNSATRQRITAISTLRRWQWFEYDHQTAVRENLERGPDGIAAGMAALAQFPMRERLVGMQEHVQDAEAVRTVTQVMSTQKFTKRYFDGGEIGRHMSPAVCHCPRPVKNSVRTDVTRVRVILQSVQNLEEIVSGVANVFSETASAMS